MRDQARQVQFQSEFSNETLDRFLFAVVGRFNQHFDQNGIEIPKTKEQLADYLSVTTRQVDKLVEAGVVKPRRTHDGGDPRYFVSEIKWH